MKSFLIPRRIGLHPTPGTSLVATLISILLLSLTLNLVSAHALMVRSAPVDGEILDESPVEVVAWFSEELDSSQSRLRVFDAQENQVDNGDGRVDLEDLDHFSMIASLPPTLPMGKYTVRWIVASADDGDATEGIFTFDVGKIALLNEPVPPSGISSTVWLFGGVSIVVIFTILVLYGLSRRKGRPI